MARPGNAPLVTLCWPFGILAEHRGQRAAGTEAFTAQPSTMERKEREKELAECDERNFISSCFHPFPLALWRMGKNKEKSPVPLQGCSRLAVTVTRSHWHNFASSKSAGGFNSLTFPKD